MEKFAELEQEDWREVREAGQQEGAQPAAPCPQWDLMPTPCRVAVGPGQGRERCTARTQAGASSRGHCRLLLSYLKMQTLRDLERNTNPFQTQAKVVGDDPAARSRCHSPGASPWGQLPGKKG